MSTSALRTSSPVDNGNGRIARAITEPLLARADGRMGRFLMNAMLASGGYPRAVIPVERRNDYMAVLKSASVQGEIKPFARLRQHAEGVARQPLYWPVSMISSARIAAGVEHHRLCCSVSIGRRRWEW